MKRILVETLFVSGVLGSAYGLYSIPDTAHKVSAEVESFVVVAQHIHAAKLAEARPAVAVYHSNERIKFSPKEIDCLTKNIYHEAGVEDYAGKIAVAQITYNRLKSSKWGTDVCKVVYARAQFSWTLDHHKVAAKPKGSMWEASRKAAHDFILGYRVDRLSSSMFYHADYIDLPKWADSNQQVHRVGQHIFYAMTK